jgi:hypothetical protein
MPGTVKNPSKHKAARIARQKSLENSFEAQSPWDAVLAHTFKRMGGEKEFLDWAKSSPGAFYKMMFMARPGVTPSNGMGGDIQIVINNSLKPTALDVISEQ